MHFLCKLNLKSCKNSFTMDLFRNEVRPMSAYHENAIPLTTMPEIHNGFEAFYSYSPKMESWEFHCHDFYEFYIHLKNGQYFAVDNDMYQLEPDQIFILPPFCMHGLSGLGVMNDYERAYVNITPDALRLLGCEQIDLDRFFRSYTSRGLICFQLTRKQAQQLVDWICDLQENQNASRSLDRFRNYAVLLNFLTTVCDIAGHSEALTETVMANSIMQKVLTYINSNYMQPLKIADIAKQFNISVSYLSHEFAKHTNRSIYEYILYRRVMLAKEMMHTEASLNSIAYQCGFNDYSNFLRMFSKIVGLSPRQYRNQLRSKA